MGQQPARIAPLRSGRKLRRPKADLRRAGGERFGVEREGRGAGRFGIRFRAIGCHLLGLFRHRNFSKTESIRNLRAIGSLYRESFHLVARKGSGIKSVQDLRGKRLSLDEPGSGTLVEARIILEAFGLSEGDLEPEYVKPEIAVKKIMAGQLDAFFIVAGYPTKSVKDLTSTIGAELVPIAGPAIKPVIEKYEFFDRDVIPAGVYAGIGETKTLSVRAIWVVDVNLDPELVYQVTKSVWNPKARLLFDKGHPKALEITVDTALDGIGIPLHPGGQRYYREIGLLK